MTRQLDFVLALCLIVTGAARAQDVTVEGVLLDGETQKPIANAQIQAPEQQVSTGEDGSFTLLLLTRCMDPPSQISWLSGHGLPH